LKLYMLPYYGFSRGSSESTFDKHYLFPVH